MAQSPILPPNRHVPFKKGGWGAAILTCIAAVSAFLGAYYIHTQTYRHPRDLMMRETFEQPAGAHAAAEPHGAPAEHTPPAAGH